MIKNMMVAGSFDPITLGHMDIISRGVDMCEQLIVCITNNTNKKHQFDADERLRMCAVALKQSLGPRFSKVTFVVNADELLTLFAKQLSVTHLLRGIRSSIDLAYESNMEAVNKIIHPDLVTVYLTSSADTSHISSSVVRELLKYPQGEASVKTMVPNNVYQYLYPKEIKYETICNT